VTRVLRLLPARLLAGVLLALALIVAPACDGTEPSAFSADVDGLLRGGVAYADSLAARGADELTDAEIIALGYLERGRLGIGSPFRLISFLLRDERLEPETRERVAYAVLGQTLRGSGYRVDPSVLHGLQLLGAENSRGMGDLHLALIERVIADAPTATSGERAVRLGYMLAGTAQAFTSSPEPVVAYVAAMVADRRRARVDAEELLRAASGARADPLELMEEWRRALRFRVEWPAMTQVVPREEIVEATVGTQVAAALRELALRLNAPAAHVSRHRQEQLWPESWLRIGTALRLGELAAAHDYPTQAPVAVAVTINRDAFVGRAGLEEIVVEQRRSFADAATTEEKLVAAARRLADRPDAAGPRMSLILLQAAVFMRGWNQEEPWFPGDPGPSTRDLENRFALAFVTFDGDVPEAWRPYYRRMLGRALGDLQRVIPTASLRGLGVRFGTVPGGGPALALHEPRTRALILPPHSGAGTIAHEVAHDLDWQLARRRYNRRGAYASDLAVNRQTGDRVANSLEGLAASFQRGDGNASAHDHRPAEVFARGMDWLIASYLAAEGRMGGYLSSFQDAAIAGYGTTRGPHVDGAAVPSLLTILEQVSPLTPEARQWALDSYGPQRSLTAKELVRAITGASREGPAFERFAALEIARDRAWAGLDAASCEVVANSDVHRIIDARRVAIRAAVSAAARGIVVAGIREAAAGLEEPLSPAAVNQFLVWRLEGGPEPADSTVHLLLPAADELALRAAQIAADPSTAFGGFGFDAELVLCGGNPFAADRQRTAALSQAIQPRRDLIQDAPRRPGIERVTGQSRDPGSRVRALP
jgi:hypothetical protein